MTQRQALEDLCNSLAALGEDVLFAVRSSSPEEDLASASFAGGYETRLGVPPADLENAVRHCFASSLDARVLVYKKERGFDVLMPECIPCNDAGISYGQLIEAQATLDR